MLCAQVESWDSPLVYPPLAHKCCPLVVFPEFFSPCPLSKPSLHPYSWNLLHTLPFFLSHLAAMEAHGKCKSVQSPCYTEAFNIYPWILRILSTPLGFPAWSSASPIPAVPCFGLQPEQHQEADVASFPLSGPPNPPYS